MHFLLSWNLYSLSFPYSDMSCLLVAMGGIINIVGSVLVTAFYSCLGTRCHKMLKTHEKANGVSKARMAWEKG